MGAISGNVGMVREQKANQDGTVKRGDCVAQKDEAEFSGLRVRYLNALKYFDTNYKVDTPEWRKDSEKLFDKIVHRMNDLWNNMTDAEQAKHMDLFR
jgi:hypothetical protein